MRLFSRQVLRRPDAWVSGANRWCYNLRLGPVAQLVEQRIENPRVGSSILPQATK